MWTATTTRRLMTSLLLAIAAAMATTEGALTTGEPRRCCTPDQWEADVRNIGTTSRNRDPDGHVTARMAYDYTNSRWAFHLKDSVNRHRSRRIVFDHNQDAKVTITSKGCYSTSNNGAKMDRVCIPANASYHHSHDYGLNAGFNPHIIGYDFWSFDMLMSPIRYVVRVSSPDCVLLQDTAFSVVRNHWKWREGEPICVPWQFPEQAYNGECFRSHEAHTIERSGSRPGGPIYNMDYRNVNLTITDEEIFRIPTDCEEVDDWPKDTERNQMWALLFLRMHLN